MKIAFLEAPMPLTKQFSSISGQLRKTPYPHAYDVTSHEETVLTLKDFETVLKKHAAKGHCAVKGELSRPLVSESRAGTTDTNGLTSWLCLDIDGLPELYQEPDKVITPAPPRKTKRRNDDEHDEHDDSDTPQTPTVIPGAKHKVTVQWLMDQLGLGDHSYVLQWSASHGIADTALRCHIMLMLDKPHPAPLVKQWLIDKNLTVPCLNAALSLTKTGNALSWPLDISACQNDKLIYIAPPVLKNIKDPLGKTPRISYVKRTKEKLSFSATVPSTAKNREAMHRRLDELRQAEGLPKRKTTYKMHGSMEVMNRPDVCIVTEMKTERGFTYFNLNGGDSWAYYHPENNPDYIYNFKGEPVYLTKDLLPDYWDALHKQTNRINSTGIMKLAFLDPKTDKYWRGEYDTLADELTLEPTTSALSLKNYCKANGVPLYDDVIPEWNLVFDPQDNVRVDLSTRTINLFQPTQYMRATAKQVAKIPKTIHKIIYHVVGSDQESYNYFINWLAYVLQTRDRATTAWVFHGVPGTGKGTLLNKVLRPIFGSDYVAIPRMKELEKEFNSFIHQSLLVCVDEVEVDALQNEKGVMADLRRYITDSPVPLRKMNRDAVKVPNYSSWLFFSNASAPVRVPRDDRRMNIAKYQDTRLAITDQELARIETELQAFHDFLLFYQVDKHQVFTPLLNQAREDIVELSENAIDSVSNAILSGDMSYFIDQLPTDQRYTGDSRQITRVEDYKSVIKAVLTRTDRNSGLCKIARDELRAIYEYTVGKIPESPNKFTSLVKHHRIRMTKVWMDGGTVNGLQVVWKDTSKWTEYLNRMSPPKPASTVPVKKLTRVK